MKSINVDEMLLNPLTHAYLRKYIQLLNWNTDNCKLNVHYRFKELGSKELFLARADYISFTYGHRVKRCFSPFRQKNSRKHTMKPIYNSHLQNVLRFVCINNGSLSWFQFYLSSLFWIAIISNYCFKLKNPALAKLKDSFTKAIRLNIMGH